MLSELEIFQFRQKIKSFYHKNGRDFLWRKDITPYKVVVSEVMLQQTQVSRVAYKFNQWLLRFSNFEILSQASVQEVLFYWQGLGYNRRGLALHDFAKRVVSEFKGVVPSDPDVLKTFKNIGPNTAGSICAFAFNQPVVFIETNIRTVFIHEFFKDGKNIDDKQLLPLIAATVDDLYPRDWYYALMDYGAYLKKELKVSNIASKHYAKQSKFVGSNRQMRGLVIKILSQLGKLKLEELRELVLLELPENKHCLEKVIEDLCKDGFLKKIEETPLGSLFFIEMVG